MTIEGDFKVTNFTKWIIRIIVVSSVIGYIISTFSMRLMDFWRRWNWDIWVQCYRIYLMERCLKSGLLLEKGHKEEVTVKEEEVCIGDLAQHKDLGVGGRRNRPISLQGIWVGNKNTESVILKTKTWRTLVTRPPWVMGMSFQYWHHLSGDPGN